MEKMKQLNEKWKDKKILQLNKDCILAILKYKKTRNINDLSYALKLNSCLGVELRK